MNTQMNAQEMSDYIASALNETAKRRIGTSLTVRERKMSRRRRKISALRRLRAEYEGQDFGGILREIKVKAVVLNGQQLTHMVCDIRLHRPIKDFDVTCHESGR